MIWTNCRFKKVRFWSLHLENLFFVDLSLFIKLDLFESQYFFNTVINSFFHLIFFVPFINFHFLTKRYSTNAVVINKTELFGPLFNTSNFVIKVFIHLNNFFIDTCFFCWYRGSSINLGIRSIDENNWIKPRRKNLLFRKEYFRFSIISNYLSPTSSNFRLLTLWFVYFCDKTSHFLFQ